MYKITKRYYFINSVDFKNQESYELFHSHIKPNKLYRGVRIHDATGKRYCFDYILSEDPLRRMNMPFRYFKKFDHPANPIDLDVEVIHPTSKDIERVSEKLDSDDFLKLGKWEKESAEELLANILQQELCHKRDIAFQIWDQHKDFLIEDEQHVGIEVDNIQAMIEDGEYEEYTPEEMTKDLSNLYEKNVDQFYYITKLIKSLV